ncbi:endonuclease [Lewinellaceae bacterium SD302]|nr:endonuclease [Lewinellaceae bacterium SD302]
MHSSAFGSEQGRTSPVIVMEQLIINLLILDILAWSFGLFGIAGTLIPFLRYDDWWIRGFDYPRVQLVFIMLTAIGLLLVESYFFDADDWVLTGIIGAALVYQVAKILPYTPIWNHQVKTTAADYEHGYFVSLLMSNVLQKNERSDLLIERIRAKDPDLILTLETNQRWQNELDAELIQDYPHTIKVPKENRYGMHLYSRLELRNETVNYHVSDDLPSIYVEVKLPNDGPWIKLYGVHPSVPSPTEEDSSTERDGELAVVGRLVEEAGSDRTIVAGDLNDVAWSHSTRLFQRLSGLLDPRRGRGFFATFHADYWFARWPLDHVFHSKDFTLRSLERLDTIQSDHFPVYVELAFDPARSGEQEELKKEDGDRETADRTTELAKNGEKDTLLVDSGTDAES